VWLRRTRLQCDRRVPEPLQRIRRRLSVTVNFLFGIPQWCVSIACEDDDGALVGVVYDPMRDEMWAATHDGDATLNGARVRASARGGLATALVATGFGYAADVRESTARVVARLLLRARRAALRRRDARPRLGGGGSLRRVLRARVKHWDVAAGALICARAGLTVQELPPAPPVDSGLLVAPPSLAGELLALITD
jgi:myo-inositol-1(or 4)-monophosphatase